MLLVIIGAGLAGLAALPHGSGANAQATEAPSTGVNITSDTYFYGQSEPVYPSPNMTGTGDWGEAFAKAQALVAKLTLEEKVTLTGGASSNTSCVGYIAGISRVGFPGLCLSDAGNGLRGTDFVSSWPSGIHVGASWNKNLTGKRGAGMGGEFKKKGANVLLGPVIGPVGRVVLSGRNWEGFSVDPYLSGALVQETVAAIQGAGVITSTKHYIGNEQETNRNPEGNAQSVSANIDDRTMHELYLWPFQDAVKAGSANIMCSYNRINNSYGCANSKTLNGLLKTELGFQGFVVSDWVAQHAGVATANAGLDMAMPSSFGFWDANLTLAVNNGSVSESRIDDMVTRILASWYLMGQDKDFPSPGFGLPASYSAGHVAVDARNPDDRPILLQGAVEGHVLVKNSNNSLPLKTPKLLSIFGYSAKNPDAYTGGSLSPDWDGSQMQVYQNGTIYMGGGSGASSPSLAVSPFDALVNKAYDDGTALYWDLHSQNPAVNPTTEACIVLVNAWASEGYDRSTTHDSYTDNLVTNVANKCNSTIVVIHNAGIRLVDAFVDHPNVTAIIFAHGPGQDSGKALVDILYGNANPSGRLPYTVAKSESDYGKLLGPSLPEGQFALFPQSNFTEGVFIDYRHFDAANIEPRYEFGFGLSYTTFNYSGLAVTKQPNASIAQFPSGPVEMGGQKDLWDVVVSASATVGNSGSVDGAEVAQLYVTLPGGGSGSTPIRQLRGFEKPFLKAGESQTISFNLTRRDLSVWDVAAQKWSLQSGDYTLSVGSSSRKLPLVQTLKIQTS
ncbi:beta-glucosidase [Thozetella sp. PMI_491]|nr:beta-glucosidase [Thozetella sp. PMI_491]